MIFERGSRCTALPTPKMLRSVSPATRPCSPAISEISVGSPSPPPSFQHVAIGFRPLIKRMRLSQERTRSPFTPHQKQQHPERPGILPTTVTRRKSTAERVKSFSIADILGKKDDDSPKASDTSSEPVPGTRPLPTVPTPSAHPPSYATAAKPLLPAINMLQERLQPPPPYHPLLADISALDKVVRPWDTLRGPGSLPLRPFLPPALLHYEQRLSWDYQRQLQEHFQAQTQLLRQMSMDPGIIPSEDGSERSRSSSTGGSECNSPEVDVQNGSHGCEEGSESRREQTQRPPSDTPLDALFQLSTKNFDEEQDAATLNIFATRPNPKKKRKSRTAFTNHQIFELEKRFLYQKYLSPADRDEIAAGLGLSNAQVITWFQNRRAKLKRDMEELKKDVESVKQLPDQSADTIHHPQHQHQQQQLQQLQQQQQQKHLQQARHLHFLACQQQPPHLLAAATRDSTSTTAEDKKEIKMLKMMTLMYYSSRNNAVEPATAAAAAGDVGNPGASLQSVDPRKTRSN